MIFVRKFPEALQKFLLPIFVMLSAKYAMKYMLKEAGQNEKQWKKIYDANLEYHKNKESYGKFFPYELLKHIHAPEWTGRLIQWFFEQQLPDLKLLGKAKGQSLSR
jgi:hypothetical protein